MKLEVTVKDSKADFILELLNNFTYVKTKKVSESKQQFLKEFEEAIEEVNQIKAGKKKSRNVEDFLNEL